MNPETSPEQLDKTTMLKIAKEAIAKGLKNWPNTKAEDAAGPNPGGRLGELGACFVTLTIKGNLRGCIGTIIPNEPLYLNIAHNALNAAFEDDRFEPLPADEFKKLEIEISVLGEPLELAFNNTNELLDMLQPGVDGVIVQRSGKSAVFLPQVWEQIPNKEEFLSELCVKAGLPPLDWQKPDFRVWTFQVEAFK